MAEGAKSTGAAPPAAVMAAGAASAAPCTAAVAPEGLIMCHRCHVERAPGDYAAPPTSSTAAATTADPALPGPVCRACHDEQLHTQIQELLSAQVVDSLAEEQHSLPTHPLQQPARAAAEQQRRDAQLGGRTRPLLPQEQHEAQRQGSSAAHTAPSRQELQGQAPAEPGPEIAGEPAASEAEQAGAAAALAAPGEALATPAAAELDQDRQQQRLRRQQQLEPAAAAAGAGAAQGGALNAPQAQLNPLANAALHAPLPHAAESHSAPAAAQYAVLHGGGLPLLDPAAVAHLGIDPSHLSHLAQQLHAGIPPEAYNAAALHYHHQQQQQATATAVAAVAPAAPAAVEKGSTAAAVKVCSKCKAEKPLHTFPELKGKRGRATQCSECKGAAVGGPRKAAVPAAVRGAAVPATAAAGAADGAGVPGLREKQCMHCLLVRPVAQFRRSKNKGDRLHNRCKDCEAALGRGTKRDRSGPVQVKVAHKLCRRCNLDKEAAQFFQSKLSLDGLCTYCKECQKDLNKQARDKRPEAPRSTPAAKVCRQCKQERPADQYFKSKMNVDGLYSYCKSCAAAVNSAAKKKRRAEVRAQKQATAQGSEAAAKAGAAMEVDAAAAPATAPTEGAAAAAAVGAVQGVTLARPAPGAAATAAILAAAAEQQAHAADGGAAAPHAGLAGYGGDVAAAAAAAMAVAMVAAAQQQPYGPQSLAAAVGQYGEQYAQQLGHFQEGAQYDAADAHSWQQQQQQQYYHHHQQQAAAAEAAAVYWAAGLQGAELPAAGGGGEGAAALTPFATLGLQAAAAAAALGTGQGAPNPSPAMAMGAQEWQQAAQQYYQAGYYSAAPAYPPPPPVGATAPEGGLFGQAVPRAAEGAAAAGQQLARVQGKAGAAGQEPGAAQ